MIRTTRALVAALLLALPDIPARADVLTTPVTLSTSAWTDLGAGPMLLSAASGRVQYVVAAAGSTIAVPAATSTVGHILNPGDAPILIETTQHVYAIPRDLTYGTGAAMVTPIASWAAASAVTANQGSANATPWNSNIAQVAGGTTNVGAGASGTGTARVAVSTDSPGGAAANPAYTNISNGATVAAVKAASTGAALADPALVVAQSPNSASAHMLGSSAFAAAQVTSIATTGSTATTLVSSRTGVAGTGRVAVTIVNTGSVTVYIGATNGVTASGGTGGAAIAPGASRTIETQAAVYGVIASGTGSCDVLETY